MASRSRFFLIALALSLLAGCQAALQGVGQSDITGIYYLVAVGDVVVPGVVDHGGTPLQMLSGVFVISADGSCSSKTRFVPPGGEATLREVSARYAVAGGRLTMQWEGAGMTEGWFEGETFVMDNHGMIFRYEKP